MQEIDYKSVFNEVPTPIYLWQKIEDELILVDYNKAAEDITLNAVGNFLGIKASELYKEQSQILDELNCCLNEQKTISREMEYIFQSTQEVKILFVIYKYIQPNLVLVHTKDLTEEKKAEEREIYYRAIVENSHSGILIVKDNYKFVYVNDKLCQMLGYSEDELIGQDFRNFLDEESKKLVGDRYVRRQRGENVPSRYEFNIVRKDGEKRRVEIISTISTELRGGITTIAQILDITERTRIGQKLKESEKKFRRIIEDSPFSIMLINPNRKIVECNPVTVKFSGYKKNELIGKDFKNLAIIHPDFFTIIDKSLSRLLKGDKISTADIQVYNKKGDLIWVNFQASQVKLNKEIFFQIITHIIDKQKKADLLIREQISRLKELNQMQNEFITRASHELKTPLMSISGASELLSDFHNNKLDRDTLELLEIIQRNKQRLEYLVNNLLDIVNIDNKRFKLKKQSCNISKIIKEAVKDLDYFLKKNEINAILELPTTVLLNVDIIRFEQVVTNIFLNAIKNSPPKSDIKIHTSLKEDFVEISIMDSGIGLTEDEIDRLFTKFGKIERIGEGLEYLDIQGSGLGLYISKEIMGLHGGTIHVKSAGRNKGATFIIKMPNK